MTKQDLVQQAESFSVRIEELRREISKVIVGQEEVINALLNGLFSHGHVLMIGVPGLAKTLLVKTLAEALDLNFNRVQFTPDLMPSDILGSEILDEKRQFKFIKGPIFSNIILADEINRTPPKTQAALLEAMQERSVTVSGKPITDNTNVKFGMVIDFGDLKKIVKQEIVDLFDHATVFNKNTPHVELAKELIDRGHHVLLVDYQPTSEMMVIDFAKKIKARLPKNIKLHSIKLQETDTSFAEWYASEN